jgi:uncharacterized membrane protein YqjE
MTPEDGLKPPDDAEKSLGEIVADVSEKVSLLVRQEIALAKTEVQDKVSALAKGAAVVAAAGFFLLLALIYFLTALAWLLSDLYGSSAASIWLGFLTVFAILAALGGVGAFLGIRWVKRGAPPTPDLAIEEAKRTREELEQQKVERDQVDRTLEKGDRLWGRR